MPLLSGRNDRISRRNWFKSAAAAGVGVAAGATALPDALDATTAAPAPVIRTPDEALVQLVAGNRRFVSGQGTANPNRSVARLRELEAKQTPFAAVLGCADSRVPVEILFDQGFGDLFVSRVAGNIATAEVIGSLEYATHLLGAGLVMVLGHTGCGAVTATVEMENAPGQISTLYPYIHPAADAVANRSMAVQKEEHIDLSAVIVQNVRHQMQILEHASPVLGALQREGKVKVVGGVFDFRTGQVNLLDV